MSIPPYVLGAIMAVAVAATGAPEVKRLAGKVAVSACEYVKCGGPR